MSTVSPTTYNSRDPEGEFPMGVTEYFFYLLFQTARQRDAHSDEAMKPLGLNLARWRTLAVIRRIENCTMSELARYCAVDRTTLTRSVDQLVNEGLVERWTPPRDRRQVNLALTAKGNDVHDRALDIMIERNNKVLGDLPPDRVREAMRVLQSVLANVAPDPRTGGDLLSFGRPRSAE